MPFPTWTAAQRCTGEAQPGVRAFTAVVMDVYGSAGIENWGIYNCRSVVGGSTTSLHGEGRAVDLGHSVGDPTADRLRRALLKSPGRLGIQALIHERVIYSAKSPSGRPYTGEAPHFDHLHVEFTWGAAKNLTPATVRTVLDRRRRKAGTRALRLGMRGFDVKTLQRRLEVSPVDGIFGQDTQRAVLAFQRKRGEVPNGIVDRDDWRSLGVRVAF